MTSDLNNYDRVEFPRDFVWGAATASYQIEGATEEDGRSESIWDRFCATPGKVLNGDSGKVADDHYHRWREDIGLMRQLGFKAYRFSIAWPRILPQGRGEVNQKGLDFYDRLVDGLLEAGIAPYATLYHWDLPQVLQDQGGWPARDTAYAYAEYTEAVLKRLGDRVKGWITHNEPWCVAFLGYRDGHHAPGLTDPRLAVSSVHHLLLSHGLAMPIIRQYAPQAQVGITLNLAVYHPARPGNAADELAVKRADCEQNRLFLDPLFKGVYPEDHALMQELAPTLVQPGDLEIINVPGDFLGINYYTRTVLQADAQDPQKVREVHPEGIYTTMGWEVYPEGLYQLLTRVQREYPSHYYITENGASTDDRPNASGQVVDELRQNYLRAHLSQARRAIDAGVQLDGYFAWSLLDNFEWAWGYDRRFGLTYVDYATQERIIKNSGYWYSDVIKANGFDK
ncbi:MAG TPA: GH1 family beta-glucosidase [Chloroflexia bacterium]|nr:GH1 family beta-glucosidase [Chloroflexia bacterium]